MRIPIPRVAALGLVLLGILRPFPASAATDNRLVIVESPGSLVSKNAKERLRAAIAKVAEDQGVQVIPQKTLPEKLLRCELPGCLPQIGAASGATYVLRVNARFAKETFKLTIELWHTDGGKRIGNEERDCPICDEQDLYTAAGDLTKGLLAAALSTETTVPAKAVPAPAPVPSIPILAAPPTPRTESNRPGNAVAYTGLALAAAGLAAIVVGAYYIGVDGDRTGKNGYEFRDTRKFGLPMLIAGGATTASGIGLVVWKLWPESASTSARISLGPTGVQVTGRFQ
jgi:hypothetical protein